MSDRFELPEQGRAAVATLIATQGATPREAGAKMWIDETGRILGSVTIGGCVDARVIQEAAEVIARNRPTVLSMSLGDEDAWALGMTCGGSVDVLIEPYVAGAPNDPIAQALRTVRAALDGGDRAVIVVPLPPDAADSRARLVVTERTKLTSGTLGAPDLDDAAASAARGVLQGGQSGTQSLVAAGRARRLYFEVHAPPLTLVIFGATHVAMPLVQLAHTLGLRTCVIDGRERFATRERFPDADEIRVGMPSLLAENLSLGPTSLVVLLSHDYKYDLPVLRAVLGSDAAYIGLLGSVRRGRALLDFLKEEGVPPQQLARVRVPVGLDIGARSAPEIALSVLAEALAVLRGRTGGAMRDRRADTVPAE
ncbi:MAG: XdhC family protein [Gemmatimonadaceae bacterium]